MSHTPESRDVGKHRNDDHRHHKHPDIGANAAEYGTYGSDNHALGALHKSHLALDVKTLGSRSDVAHHHRTYHSHESHNTSPLPSFYLKQIVANAKESA